MSCSSSAEGTATGDGAGPAGNGIQVDGQRRADFDAFDVGFSQGVEDVGKPAVAAKLAVLAAGIVTAEV